MANEIPFWSGKDVTLIFTFLDTRLVIDMADMEITREGDEVADDICGEDRARLQFITTHYDVVINSMQQKCDQIKAFIKEQDALDQRTLPKQSAVGILVKPNDGTQEAFQCLGYVLGKWKLGIKGRKERNSLSLPGRCQYFRTVPTI